MTSAILDIALAATLHLLDDLVKLNTGIRWKAVR